MKVSESSIIPSSCHRLLLSSLYIILVLAQNSHATGSLLHLMLHLLNCPTHLQAPQRFQTKRCVKPSGNPRGNKSASRSPCRTTPRPSPWDDNATAPGEKVSRSGENWGASLRANDVVQLRERWGVRALVISESQQTRASPLIS